jgi:hypothetical protein
VSLLGAERRKRNDVRKILKKRLEIEFQARYGAFEN